MKWELIVIPIITAIFTSIILYIKELKQSKITLARSINEKKLTELYNKLFSISLIHQVRLEQSFFVTPKGMFNFDGESIPTEDKESIQDTEVWDELIKEIRLIIHEKLHLLDQEDLNTWYQLEIMELEERFNNTINIKKYRTLELFFKNITLRYTDLYNKYHMKT